MPVSKSNRPPPSLKVDKHMTVVSRPFLRIRTVRLDGIRPFVLLGLRLEAGTGYACSLTLVPVTVFPVHKASLSFLFAASSVTTASAVPYNAFPEPQWA